MNTYDPKKVIVTFATLQLSGFAPDSVVVAEADEDAFTKTVGVQGEVARARSGNDSGSFTVTLLQTSKTNDLLSAIASLDKVTGAGVAPFTITDLSGGSVATSVKAWIRKVPPLDLKKGIEVRTWVFDCEVLDIHVAGNADNGLLSAIPTT